MYHLSRKTFVASLIGLLGFAGQSQAADQTIPGNLIVAGTTGAPGNLTVTGTSDLWGNTLGFGNQNGQPGVTALFSNGDIPTLSLVASGSSSAWFWGYSPLGSGSNCVPVMTIDSANRLSLFSRADPANPALVLDPDGGVLLNGSQVLTKSVADGFYVSGTSGLLVNNGKIGIGNANPVSLLDVAGNLAVGAYAGNIPAPTDGLIVSGRVGIGTGDPQVALDVHGDARIAGTLVLSGSGNGLVLPDGTLLSASNSIKEIMLTGTAFRAEGLAVELPATQVSGTFLSLWSSGTNNQLPNQLLSSSNSILTQKLADQRYIINGSSSASIGGSLSITAGGSLTLPDGTVLSGSNSLSQIIGSGTARSISGQISSAQVVGLAAVATTGSYASLQGRPTIPTNTNELINGAGFIASSGTGQNVYLTGTTRVSGTLTMQGILIMSGTASKILLNPAGDLSMGAFTNGSKP